MNNCRVREVRLAKYVYYAVDVKVLFCLWIFDKTFPTAKDAMDYVLAPKPCVTVLWEGKKGFVQRSNEK